MKTKFVDDKWIARTVAIVGTHPRTREYAPWDDPNIDIWVFNEAPTGPRSKEDNELWCKRCSAVFQMHQPGVYRSPVNRADPKHWNWLQQEHPFPIYMIDSDENVPARQTYPLAEIANELLGGLTIEEAKIRGFFTSSIAYGIALAIYQGYDRILLYGVEMGSETEYVYQRDCVTAWVFYALGRGIKVDLHCAQSIFDRPLYGYDGLIEQNIDDYLARAEELTEKIFNARSEVGHAEHTLHTCFRTETHPCDAIGKLLGASIELGKIEGALEANDRYLGKLRSMQLAGAALYLDRNEFEAAAGFVKDDIEKYGQEVHRSAGRLDYVLNVWLQFKTQQALDQLKTFTKAHIDAGYNFGKAQGIHTENYRHALALDEKVKAAGGAKAVAMLIGA